MTIWSYIAASQDIIYSTFSEMLTLDEVSVVSTDYIDYIYGNVVDILRIGSNSAVPVYRRNFFKY